MYWAASVTYVNNGNTTTQWPKTKDTAFCSDQCGTVGWASSHKAKGRWFDSQSGQKPALQVRSLVGRSTYKRKLIHVLPRVDVSLPFSRPSPISKNKIIFF